MTLQVTGKNLDVGEALRNYVTDRIEQTLGKFFGSDLSGHVRIEKERNQFLTNCSIQLSWGLAMQAHGESQDAYASADLAIERLEKRVRRYKRRLKKHHGHGSAKAIQQAPYYVIQADGDDDQEPEDDNPVIIAETQTEILSMSVSDAVMRMDLSDRTFLIFRNAGHDRINVVYRRPDGNIGWIDPGGMGGTA